MMIERVKQTLSAKLFLHGVAVNDAMAEELARAAIAAMREPSSSMLKAACSAMSPGKRPTPDHVSSRDKHRIRYQAMIDAAKEAPEVS